MLFQRRRHATDAELSAHLDGRLDKSSHERVARHVDGCLICQEALDGLRVVQTSLRSLPREKAPRSFALREADVRPARAAGRLVGAMPLLSSITAIAMVAFLAVMAVDVLGGSSSSHRGATSGGGVPAAAIDYRARSATEVRSSAGAEAATSEARILGPALGAVQATLTAASSDLAKGAVAAPPVATPMAGHGSPASGGDTKLHMAEAALAAVALVSGGSAVALARRRKA